MPHYVIVDKDLLDPDDDSSIAMHEALRLRSDRGRDHHARVKFTEKLTRTNARLYLYEVRLVSVGDGTMFTGAPKPPKARAEEPTRMKHATLEAEIQTNEIQPNPTVYPRCTECHTPYVLRLGIMLTGKQEWAWFRDCRHRKAPAEIVDKQPKTKKAPSRSSKPMRVSKRFSRAR